MVDRDKLVGVETLLGEDFSEFLGRLKDVFISENKSAPVHTDALSGLQVLMDLDGFFWVNVVTLHHPSRAVRSNRDEGEIVRSELCSSLLESRTESCVSTKVDLSVLCDQRETRPETVVGPNQLTCLSILTSERGRKKGLRGTLTFAPMLARCGNESSRFVEAVLIPPREFDDILETLRLAPSPETQRDDPDRLWLL